jgi:hypothetical protein
MSQFSLDKNRALPSAKLQDSTTLDCEIERLDCLVSSYADTLTLICERALKAGAIWRPSVRVCQVSLPPFERFDWYWRDTRAVDPHVGPFKSRIHAALDAIADSGLCIESATALLGDDVTQDVLSRLANYQKLREHQAYFSGWGELPQPSSLEYGDYSDEVFAQADSATRFDGTEIGYLAFLDPSTDDPKGSKYVDQVSDVSDANFFSTFLHFKTGGTLCCGDFVTLPEAQLCAAQLDQRFGWA